MPLRKKSYQGRKTRRRAGHDAAPCEHQLSRWAPVPVNSPVIDHALEFWQPLSPRQLTREDAREIIENMTGFFSVLMEWEMQDRGLRLEDGAASDSGLHESS